MRLSAAGSIAPTMFCPTLACSPAIAWVKAAAQINASNGFVIAECNIVATYGLPCELKMNGPARLTDLTKPLDLRSFTNQSRWIWARACGAFPVLCAAS